MIVEYEWVESVGSNETVWSDECWCHRAELSRHGRHHPVCHTVSYSVISEERIVKT